MRMWGGDENEKVLNEKYNASEVLSYLGTDLPIPLALFTPLCL